LLASIRNDGYRSYPKRYIFSQTLHLQAWEFAFILSKCQALVHESNFCKMTKHNLVQFNTEVYYQKCSYLYQSNVYTLFN